MLRFMGAIALLLVGGELVLASEIVLRYVVYETKGEKVERAAKEARTVASLQLATELGVPYSGKARIGTQELAVSGILRPANGGQFIECQIDASYHHDVALAPLDVDRVQTRVRLENGKELSLSGFDDGAAFVLVIVDKGK